MSNFVFDTFTGTGNLSTHTGETGATWTGVFGGAASEMALDGTGSAYCNVSPVGDHTPWVEASGTSVNANYSVVLDFTIIATTYSEVTLLARMTPTPTGYIILTYTPSDGNCNLATSGPDSLNVTAPNSLGAHTLELRITGNSVALYFDAALLDTLDITASSLPAAGTVGFGLYFIGGAGPYVKASQFSADSRDFIATTDSSDTTAIYAGTAVAAIESGDSAAISVSVTTGADIISTDSSDVAFLLSDSLIDAVESGDTILITTAVTTGAPIAAVESGDTTAVAGFANLARLAAVDKTDTTAVAAWTVLVGTMSSTGPKATIFAFAYSEAAVSYGVHGTGPVARITARAGATCRRNAPKPKLSVSATVTLLGTMRGTGPVARITASGSNTRLARLDQVWSAKYAVTARTGAVLRAKGPVPSGLVSGLFGLIGGVRGTYPRYLLTSTGTLACFGTINAVESSDITPTKAYLLGTGPRATMAATGRVEVTVEYEAYSVTLIQGQEGLRTATTRYTNYPFNQIVRWEGKYYGVATDGLFELGGNDFDGAPIVSTVTTAETDFGRPEFKRAIALYLAGRAGADFGISLETAEVDEDTYPYYPADKTGARAYRALFGKGVRAHYWAYKMTNTRGEDFAFDTMTPDVAVTRRTI